MAQGISNSDQRPPSKVVVEFHTNSDVDGSASSQHHTLGTGINQAASGAHNHDGSNSAKLLGGLTIGGSRASGAALMSVIAAMERLGATDETTP